MITKYPISSACYGKILVFTLILLASSLFLIGIIPLIFFLFFGAIADRKNDFSSIETGALFIKVYAHIAAAIAEACFIFLAITENYGNDDYFIGAIIVPMVWGAFLFMTNNLILYPLRGHADWISANGIFTKKSRQNNFHSNGKLDVTKSEYTTYSAADELLKWAKLKEDGHITESDFAEIKVKILNK